MPGLYEILDGRVGISPIRDVQIEDLLGREPVQLDIESINRELAGKVVMVTGAGGSIGSELARQVLRFSPTTLLLVERAEFALFDIDSELRQANPTLSIVPRVVDVGDEIKMRYLFDFYRPQVVIHAAAHKHVPLMEANPFEAIKNNVLATHLVAKLAGEYGVEVFVLITGQGRPACFDHGCFKAGSGAGRPGSESTLRNPLCGRAFWQCNWFGWVGHSHFQRTNSQRWSCHDH